MSSEPVESENIFRFGKYYGETFMSVYEKDLQYVNWVKSIPEPSGKMIPFLNFIKEREMCKNLSNELKQFEPNQTTLDRFVKDPSEDFTEFMTPPNVTVESDLYFRKKGQLTSRSEPSNKRKKLTDSPTPDDISFIKDKDYKKEKQKLSPSLQEMLDFITKPSQESVESKNQDEVKDIELEGLLAFVLYSEKEFYLCYTKTKSGASWWSLYVPPEVYSVLSKMNLKTNNRQLGKEKLITYNASDYNVVLKCLRSYIKDKNSIEPVPNFVLRTFPEFSRFSREMVLNENTRKILLGVKDDYTKDNIGKMKELIGTELWDQLKPFQREGVEFAIGKNGRVLIGDEMGLGKTIQALAISAFYRDDWPLLIICPSSLRFQWRDQCLNWLPHLVNEDDVFVVKTSKPYSNVKKVKIESVEVECSSPLRNELSTPSRFDSKSVKTEYCTPSRTEMNQLNKINKTNSQNVKSLTPNGNVNATPNLFKSDEDETPQNFSSSDTQSSDGCPYKIVIISYDLMVRMKELDGFKAVICDESHYLKNQRSQRSKRVVPLLKEATRVVLLSGTPALNLPSELFEQICSIIPGFSSNHVFVERYCKKKMNFFSKRLEYVDSKHTHELHLFLVNTVMIRRLKSDVMTELPPKIRSKIPVEIPEKLVKETKSLLSGNPASFNQLSESYKDGGFAFQNLSELETKGEPVMQKLFMLTGQGKIKGVCKYLEEYLDNNDKFIVFGHHIFMLDAIEDTLKKNKVKYIRIDGKTDPAQRQKLIQQFQYVSPKNSNLNIMDYFGAGTNGPVGGGGASDKKNKEKGEDEEIKVALLSISCCGVGLDLNCCSTVIFAELYWVPGILLQAEDRVHRIGTKFSTININYLIAQNSVDELIWKVINKKYQSLTSTLNGITTNISLITSKSTTKKSTKKSLVNKSLNPKNSTKVN